MDKRTRTFTFRACVIGIFAMIMLGLWVHYHEVLAPMPNILAENSPPAGAVGIFVGVLLLGGLVTLFRRRLRLERGELLVIYTMLVVAAPLYSQGMWHRFLGLAVRIPYEQGNMALVDSYSEKLWPHGPHLVENRRFEDGLGAHCTADPADRIKIIDAPKTRVGQTRAVQLHNPEPEGAGEVAPTTLRIRVSRYRNDDPDDEELLTPGETYYATALFRISDDFRAASVLTVELAPDNGESVPIIALRRETTEVYSRPGGFQRAGKIDVNLPRTIDRYVDLVFRLEGPGTAAITDVTFFNNEALNRLFKGSTEVRESDLARVDRNQRDSLVVRPDDLTSPRGIWYVMKGYIPYDQWARPILYWAVIVMAMFLGLLGIGVIFRKQWAENERFPFPMIVVPRLLLEEREEGGLRFRPIFRSGAFKIGIAVALAYCALQGVAFYRGGKFSVNVNLVEYVSSPATKAFIRGMAPTNFTIMLLFVSIAFFVELDMLLSILIFFWLSKVPYYFGELLGWKNIRGPQNTFPFPHEQHIGAFLSLALIVLWTSRRHLKGVGRRILGLPGGVDDSGEAMKYRTAAALVLGAFITFAVWGSMTGLGAGSALLFFGFLVICGLSAARIRTECGAPSTYFTPYFPYLIFFLMGGLMRFSLETMILAFMAGGFMAVAQFLLFAPTQVEMLQLAEVTKAKPRGVNKALIVGALGGIFIGGYFMLVWAYGTGAQNIPYMKGWAVGQNWYYRPLRKAVTDADAQSAAKDKAEPGQTQVSETAPVVGVGAGAAITLLLSAMRTRFVGFWLHPIGYILANTHFVHGVWGSLLVAWSIKWVTLKVGGPRIIREKLTPFFVGVFIGAILGMAFWDVVGVARLSMGLRPVFTCFP